MKDIKEVHVSCPYCGEIIEIDVDHSVETRDYIEDCQVCCQPIHFIVTTNETGRFLVRPLREDDV